MSLWGRIFASIYDASLKQTEEHGFRDVRREVCGGATGRVLELGAGTGLNLAHYAPGTDLTVTEPEEPMAKRLEARDASVQVVRAPAERLPFEDGAFDTVVSTLCLCTVEDPQRSLQEIERVLTPGGTLRFAEHVRHGDHARARKQDRIDPLWKRFGHGCRCNRPTPDLIRAAGFEVDVRERHLPKAPSFLQPLAVGVATRA